MHQKHKEMLRKVLKAAKLVLIALRIIKSLLDFFK